MTGTPLRFALRSLSRSLSFTLTAVASLAAGVFVVAATFAITNAYLIRAMPFPAADRLVRVFYAPQGEREPRGLPTIEWASLSDVIEWADVSAGTRAQLIDPSGSPDLLGIAAAPGTFEALGIALSSGRAFTADEHRAGAEKVVIVSPSLLSHSATQPLSYINLAPPNSGDPPTSYRVVGVLPAGFRYARDYGRGDIEFILPQVTPATAYMLRLREGVSIATVTQRMNEAVRRVATPLADSWQGVRLVSVKEDYVAGIRQMLIAITAAAGLVLLIVAANVAVLVVLRTLRQEREIAVRVALGASRSAIAQLIGTELAVICFVAAVIGLGATTLVVRALAPVVESRLGRPVPGGIDALSVDSTVLLVAGSAVLFIFALLSLAPMLLPLAKRVERSLREGGRGGTDGIAARRMRSAMIALQVAASVTLVFGGGLIVRSVANLANTDFGYAADELVRTRVRFPVRTFPDSSSMEAFQFQLESEIASRMRTPVAFSTVFPFFQKDQQRIGVVGTPTETRAAVNAVGSGYFDVVGTRVEQGRAFDQRDRLTSERVAIVSASLARQLWPGGNAIGQVLRTGADMNSGTPPTVARTVIAVVADVHETHRDADYRDVYLPSSQMGTRFAAVVGRAGSNVREWNESIREIARNVNPSIDVGDPVPFADGAEKEIAGPKFLMTALLGLGALAVGIALVGIYGVTSYAVHQRQREIAIRSALGAPSRALVRFFVAETGRVLAFGAIAGAVGAYWLGRVLRNQLFDVAPFDVTSAVAALIIVATGCLIAAWLPGRRAASVSPASALRAD